MLQDVAEELLAKPPSPVLPKDQLALSAELRQDKKRPAAKEKKNFVLKTHKRRTKEGQVSTFAIVETAVNKQIVQLSETACNASLSKIEEMINSLNEGTITKSDAIAAIDAVKSKKP